MQQLNEKQKYIEQEQEIDIREIFFRIISKWYWLVLCGFLGLIFAWIYNRYTVKVWQIESSILVSEKSKAPGVKDLFEGLNIGNTVNMENHIGLLKSYSLNRQAIENLGWRTSWFIEEQFRDREYYGNEPYKVVEAKDFENIANIPVFIKVISDSRFHITIESNAKINGRPLDINIDQEWDVGVPFISPYFRFTLEKGAETLKPGSNLYFRFNDKNKMTLVYREKLSVALTNKTSEILRLSVNGSQPNREVAFLNELAKVYIQFGLLEKNRTSKNTVVFIDMQLKGIADSLRIAGQSFTDFRSENQVIDLTEAGGLVMKKLENIETEKAISEMRLVYFKSLRNYIISSDGMKEAVSPSVVGIVDPTLNSMVMKLSELYSRREVLSYSAQDINPALIMIDNEIKSTRNSLRENLTNLELNTAAELKNMKNRIKEVNKSVEQLPKTEQKLINIKRRFDINNDLYTLLLTKRAEAAIILASNVADAQIIDRACLETAKIIGLGNRNKLLIGLMLGMALPVIILLLSDFLNNTVRNREEVEKATDLPIIGLIGHNTYDKEFVVTEHPRSSIAEAFRGLRTSLKYILKEKNQNVIGIHSIIPNEGKSFNSLNLACIMAMNSKKVLLVAADMRKPRLNLIFGKEHPTEGLSTYLINYNQFNEIIIPTKIENLSFVSSGPIPPNPAELLENNGIEKFLSEARLAFDYVIVDNPPVSLVTDGIITGRFCDANFFVLRQNYSHIDQVKFIDQLAAKNEMKNINIIMNDVVIENYGYGYKYSYGGKYGKDGRSGGYYDDVERRAGWKSVIFKIKNNFLKVKRLMT